MVQLTRKTTFSALRRMAVPGLADAENERRFGMASRLHGHDYALEVTVAGDVDPRHGMVVNISDLKPVLASLVIEVDGQLLTAEHPLLAGKLPGPEVLAGVLWDWLRHRLAEAGLDVRLDCVRLRQSRTTAAEAARGENGPVVTLTRTYEFAAAHRLHTDEIPETENRDLFGKCNNPAGHGHNYVLEVTVGGEPDPQTGLIADLPQLDAVVGREVVDRYDHRHLNYDLPEFGKLIPTSENLVRVIWERLAPQLPAGTLRRVLLRETDRNSFSYEGEQSE
jgi:6-pyruvoyltetrahydropterin/6-carboxytetrahydropterin synthase